MLRLMTIPRNRLRLGKLSTNNMSKSLFAFQITICALLTYWFPFSQATAADSYELCNTHRTLSADGKIVSIKGHLVSDGMHSTVIEPDQCQGSGYSIIVGEGENAWGVVQASLMHVGRPGTVDKSVEVDIEGVIVGGKGVRVTKLNKMVITYPYVGP